MTTDVERRKLVAYVGVGANLGDPIAQVHSARQALQHHPGLREIAFSRLYRSIPMGPADQPDYVNAVMAVETALAPLELLRILQEVEARHGRVRSRERWGPRVLDLDLLLYGEEVIETDTLRVPHPGIGDREFVLVPLAEIAPELVIPGKGALRDLIEACPRRESTLTVIDDA